MDAGNQRSQHGLLCNSGQLAQGAVAFEHRLLHLAHNLYLEEVIHHPQARKACFVGCPADLSQFGAYPRGRFYPLNGRGRRRSSPLTGDASKDVEEPIDISFCVVEMGRDANGPAAYADEDVVGG